MRLWVMRCVYVVSHAQSLHHVERRVGGWYDTGLTELGRSQAEKTAMFLASEVDGDAVVFSSDLKRASETAEIIAGRLGASVQLNDGLREMNYGLAGGKSLEWGDEHIVPQPLDGDRMNHRIFDGAESKLELAERVNSALSSILTASVENIVVVTHGFASTFVVMAWMRIPVEYLGYVNLPSKPGCVSKLVEDDFFGNRGVKYLCRTDHL
ncbi:MAG: histidine phosphatase family protein [Candidatus Bathyarchaeota archaeon]|nr:histidine phosphatase family protein [Candidatus Bathyarchaeota archaeon]